MPIKPESITQQQAERFAELMDADFGRFLNDYAAIPIDKIANALIEAGIVSPPVYVVRSLKTGNLRGCECIDNLLIAPDEDSPLEALCEYEHWKGQAE